MITDQLAKYYATIAQQYERVYDKPERQEDLEVLRDKVADVLEGHTVLELACGTGYWTEVIAESAESVLATDVNDEMLALARVLEWRDWLARPALLETALSQPCRFKIEPPGDDAVAHVQLLRVGDFHITFQGRQWGR